LGSRTWIKIYCDKWLTGSLRDDPPEIRGVWIDLLALAGSGQYGDSGEIKLANEIGLTDAQICEILSIKKALWQRAKQRFLITNRIKIGQKSAILIVNWAKYQSEYERQRDYRPPRKSSESQIEALSVNRGKTVTKSYNAKLQPKVRPEKEIEIEMVPHPTPGVGVFSFKEENDSIPPFHDSGFETVRTAYERDFGLLVPLQGQMIEDALRCWPVVWIVEAMNIAVANNVRKWAYVKGILERWENEGKGIENESKQDTEFPPYEEIVAPDGHLIGVGQTIEDIRRRDREAGF